MPRWLDELQENLARLDAHQLRRHLVAIDRSDQSQSSGRIIRRQGQSLLNFASNDYLGLADHPRLRQAAIDATHRFGTGSGASRLVTGHLTVHAEAEARFARFKHAEAALLCPTGYLANLAVLTTLAGPGDLICIDKLCHASLIDAARTSGATVRVYPHLNTDKLSRLLERPSPPFRTLNLKSQISDPESQNSVLKPDSVPDPQSEIAMARAPRRFIVTDSVFSMDGDCADLPALCDLASSHDAILIVDEAHGTGILGATGAGLCEAQGVSDRVDVVISTASKALGGLGGIITAKQVVIDTLINHARSFIYTTAVPASQAAAITAALDVVRDEPHRQERVLELARKVRALLADIGMGECINSSGATEANSDGGSPIITPIIPIITGSADSALALAAHLAEHFIHAPAIRPPTVAPNASRVRLSLRADMLDEDVDQLASALRAMKR